MRIGTRTGLLQPTDLNLEACARGFGWIALGFASAFCLFLLSTVFVIMGLHRLSPWSFRARVLRDAYGFLFAYTFVTLFTELFVLPRWLGLLITGLDQFSVWIAGPLLLWQTLELVRDFSIVLGRREIRFWIRGRLVVFALLIAANLLLPYLDPVSRAEDPTLAIVLLVLLFLSYFSLVHAFLQGRRICLSAMHGVEGEQWEGMNSLVFMNRWWGH